MRSANYRCLFGDQHSMKIFTIRVLLILASGLALAACSSSGDIAGTNGTTDGTITNGALKLIAAAFQATVRTGTGNVNVLRTSGTTRAVGVGYSTSEGPAMAAADDTAVDCALSSADGYRDAVRAAGSTHMVIAGGMDCWSGGGANSAQLVSALVRQDSLEGLENDLHIQPQ